MNMAYRVGEFNEAAAPRPFFIAREKDVMHLIRNGALVYNWLDLETTDKDWMHLEATVASLTTTDIGYNLLSDELYEVCVPDRVGLSPEAMLITRYRAEDVRNKERLSPQHAVAKIFEDVQAAPLKLWTNLAQVREKIGKDLWQEYIDEREVEIPGATGKVKNHLVRHLPLLNDKGDVVLHVRVHEPSPTREFMQMSYLTDGRKYDYQDEHGNWRLRNLDKFNLGFRNTFFDNRAMAELLFRAGFPLKEIYAMNRKGLGNHAADVFTVAITNHFFSSKGRERLALGERREAETSRTRISAKLDLIMDKNTRLPDDDAGLPRGVRVYDGTLHNVKKGHNAPDYDNAKSIGVHAYLRRTDGALLAHIESLGNIDYFRRFMTFEDEEGVPTTHPIRFIIASANDDKIYRAVPVFVLGSDDAHGKFNRIWTMRADVDYRHHRIEGKLVTDMDEGELTALMKAQRGQPGAIFHEIHLKRHRGAVDMQTGLDAGLCPDFTPDGLRFMRDYVIDHYDDNDKKFLSKAMNAYARQHSFTPPSDNTAQPYVEEEIWTAMGEVKYNFVKLEDGQEVPLPAVIRDMAQNEFDRVNHRVGDTLRALLRVQPLELEASEANALRYAQLRAEKEKKLERYQSDMRGKPVRLPDAQYDPVFLKKNSEIPVPVEDVFATMIEDKLHLMDKVPETTRAYEVQQWINPRGADKGRWQRIPFPLLARIPEHRLIALKDDGHLRVVFEENPNRPSYRFMLRYFMENGMGDLLSGSQREFYMAETAFYVSGPPYVRNPLDHRAMSWPKQRISIEKIRANEHPGIAYMRASRDGEKGAHEIFASEDMAEAILASVEKDGRRIANAYKLTDERKLVFGVDPSTDRAMANVKYEIPNTHFMIDVPDAHTALTASHPLMGPICLVVPDAPKLGKAKHIVIREEKSGRCFLAAESLVCSAPPRKQSGFDAFWAIVDAAYARAGKKPPREKDMKVISCAELAPISKTKDPKYPALHVPHQKLIGTRAPREADLPRDEPVRGFLRRKYDLSLREEQKLRLRGIDAAGAETGWEAVARISAPPRVFSLSTLLADLEDPAKKDDMRHMAFACGFGTTDHMKAYALDEFTRFDEQLGDKTNMLIFFEIDPVKKIGHWTPRAPRACFERKPDRKKKPRMKEQQPEIRFSRKRKQLPVPKP